MLSTGQPQHTDFTEQLPERTWAKAQQPKSAPLRTLMIGRLPDASCHAIHVQTTASMQWQLVRHVKGKKAATLCLWLWTWNKLKSLHQWQVYIGEPGVLQRTIR
jgi:hypothetical protein